MIKAGLTWYALVNILLFALYGLDKKQAIIHGRRISEITLHSLALAGGFAGGLFGMFLFHHKTRKPTFLWINILSGAIHISLWGLIYVK